jgi:alpha-glucoside transport system permease protein
VDDLTCPVVWITRYRKPIWPGAVAVRLRELPCETLESALIDGASHFTRLILPLSVPALASVAIFLGIANLVGCGQDWCLLTAEAFASMIVALLVFFALQRYFVRGLMAGSVKGQ